jgi:cytidylate kinase
MSGLEVVGAISACITLVDLSKKLLDAAGDAHGLPEAFRVVQNLLPLIARTLQNAKDRSKTASKDDLVAVESALGSCRRDAQDLKDILEKVVTSEKDGHFTRYKKHMRSVGKGHKVETLARQIFEQLQLLQANHVFANVATRGDLKAAVIKLEEITSSEQSISRQILDSLLFEEIEWREEQIHESYGASFNWIFEDSSTPFKQWLDTGNEAFWICGKAGSGKSTLMKFLANHPVTDGNLRQWAGTHKLITIKHFFWNSGTKMQ